MGMSDKEVNSKDAALAMAASNPSAETTASILADTKAKTISFMKSMAGDAKSVINPPKISNKAGFKLLPENKEIMK